MPTEHEFKYVLKIDRELLRDLFLFFFKYVGLIDQGYLNTHPVLRIRRQVPATQCDIPSYFLTTKVKTPIRLIEIEQGIDERDGFELFKLCSNKVKKLRYQILSGIPEIDWFVEVDCFYCKSASTDGWPYVSDVPYLIMAEVEMPEGMDRPKLPEFLQKHLLYEVPLTDNRFSNTNLGDVEYTTRLYQNLLKEESENAQV